LFFFEELVHKNVQDSTNVFEERVKNTKDLQALEKLKKDLEDISTWVQEFKNKLKETRPRFQTNEKN